MGVGCGVAVASPAVGVAVSNGVVVGLSVLVQEIAAANSTAMPAEIKSRVVRRSRGEKIKCRMGGGPQSQ